MFLTLETWGKKWTLAIKGHKLLPNQFFWNTKTSQTIHCLATIELPVSMVTGRQILLWMWFPLPPHRLHYPKKTLTADNATRRLTLMMYSCVSATTDENSTRTACGSSEMIAAVARLSADSCSSVVAASCGPVSSLWQPPGGEQQLEFTSIPFCSYRAGQFSTKIKSRFFFLWKHFDFFFCW